MAERVMLTPSAQQRLEKLQQKYKPKRPPAQASPVELELGQVAVTLCRDELLHAKAAFEAFRWLDAAKLYGDVRRHAEAIRTATPSQPEIDAVVASAMLGEAASRMNLQDTDEAASLLAVIQETALTDRQRCTLATALVQTGAPARAESLVESVSAASRDEPYWKEARQLIDLLVSGTLPTFPVQSASLLNLLSQHYLRINLVTKAGEAALEGLSIASKGPLLRASLLATAMVALLRTVFEDDLEDDGIPVAARREYAERIAESFPEVFRADLLETTRVTLLGVGLNYASSVRERGLLRWLLEHTDENMRDQAASPDGARAFQLATEGKITEAAAALPRSDHPWRFELQRCQLIAHGGDVARAVDELRVLATSWPNRIPIHATLADLLPELERHGEAAEHAAIVWRLFPTDSMVELLARCLVNSNQGERALEVLGDHQGSEHVAELRAYAADQAQNAAAPSHWREFLRYRPQSRAGNLRLALALARMGDAEGAARQARELVTRELDRLERDELAACGQILSLARFLPGVDDLIRRVAETLRIRFPNDDTAEFQRLALVSALGFPDGVAPIDYARLAKSGHVRAVSLDDVMDLMGKRRDLAIAAHRLYSEGWLSFPSFAELTGIRTADVIVRSTVGDVASRLRAPIQPSLSEESEDLKGKTFFCSPLELLLLGHCRVLQQIPDAIAGGRLITTQDSWTSMLEDAYFLEQTAQRDEATRIRSLLARLSGPQVIQAGEEGPDGVVAAARGCKLVTTTASESDDIDVLALLGSIAASGRLSRSDLNTAARHLGKEVGLGAPQALPGAPLFLETGLVDILDRAGVLHVVLQATEGVVISVRDVEFSSARLRDLELAGDAAKLQREVLQGLGEAQREGWFEIVASPPSVPLPPFREGLELQQATLLTHSIRDLLPVKHLLEQHTDWHRVTADSFGFDSLGHPDQWKALALTPNEGHAFVARYWLRHDREISLSRFVRALAHGPQRAEAVRTLARLGFTDVVLPSDITNLAEEFGRVDAGRPGDILDGVEASAGDELARGVFCRTQIGMAYAMATWRIARLNDFERVRDVPVQLMQRLERIDNLYSTRLVEQTLGNLFLCALDDRDASFVKSSEETYKLDRTSPAGKLWAELAAWQAGHSAREAATRRAVAHAWEVLGDLKDGPSTQAQWAPLGLVTDVLVKDAGVNTDVPSPDAVVAVMSADWKERPLARRSVTFSLGESHTDRPIEDLLHAAAKVLEEDTKHTSDGTSLSFDFQPAPDGPVATVSVPYEAALLRAAPSSASRAATRLAACIGVFDGRLRRALVDFAKDPTNSVHRKYLARAACNTPFRLVADDPRFLLCLGDRASASQQGFPANLAELRELLSEPPRMLTGRASGIDETEMPLEFERRLADDGFWGGRHDKAELVHFASRMPGRLPAVAARSLIAGTDADELREIVAVLRSSTGRSIGELAIATALAVYGCFGDYDDALKVELVQALSSMLEEESTEAAPEVRSLASMESSALNAVGRVVGRLAIVPIPLTDHAWLTQRLYEWWVRLASSKAVVALSRGEPVRGWHEVRAEVALNVILDALEVQLIGLHRPPLPVTGLVANLVELACSRHGNPFEPSPRIAGWLYWRRPQGVGWLAASIALWIDPNSFFDLRPEIRLAVLDRLPRTSADAEQNGISFASFVPALSRFISRLTSPEVDAVRAWLATAESSELLDLWRADVLTSFVAAHGDAADAEQLRALATLESLAKARAELFLGYLEAVSSGQRHHLYETVFEMADAIEAVAGVEVIAHAIELALARPRASDVRSLFKVLDGLAAASEHLANSRFVAAIRDAVAAGIAAVSSSGEPVG